ncbi:MAG: hypothetical protein ACK5MK_01655, partial [Dysgonomonas sp.]
NIKNMKATLKNISYALVLLLTFSSCSKDDDKIVEPIEEETPATIYIGGYSNETENMGEVIWRNGIPLQVYKPGMLSSGYVRYADAVYDLDIVNGDVYAVWKMSHKATSAYYPTAHIYLWKNDQNTPIVENDYNIYPKAIAKHGADLYFAGYYTSSSQYPSIWKNGNRTQLPGGTGTVNDLLVSNTDVLAVGYLNIGQQTAAAYWKNGILTNLNQGYNYCANAVAQTGNDIYVVGEGNEINNPRSALLWKNGTQQILPLPVGQIGASANAVALETDKVYVAGYAYTAGNNSEKAVVWIDGSPMLLSTTKSIAYSVAVKGNSAYVCGYEKPGNKQIAVMWKIKDGNVETTKLSQGKEDALATCIKVK